MNRHADSRAADSVVANSTIDDSKSSVAPKGDLAWSDTTRAPEAYTAETRMTLIDRVRNLPSISLADAGFNTLPAISDRATVRKPEKINGIESWTVEHVPK